MTPAQILPAMLGAESFLLATVGLTATLTAPGRGRVPRLPVRGPVLGALAAGLVVVAALGALIAWSAMYVGGTLRSLVDVALAAPLLVLIVGQPVLGVLLALGLRTED